MEFYQAYSMPFIFPLRCSDAATHQNIFMKKETENEIDNFIRDVYEIHYGNLSDSDIQEIRTNLRTFAESVVEIASQLEMQKT